MRRIILPVAAILLTAGCGNTLPVKTPPVLITSRPPTGGSHSAAAPSNSAASAAKAKPSPSSATTCPPTRDVIVWTKVPDLPDSAQVLGGNGGADCEPTFQFLERSSPTEAGYCTEAAWASDNPGYNADATPAARLKKVQAAIGPAC